MARTSDITTRIYCTPSRPWTGRVGCISPFVRVCPMATKATEALRILPGMLRHRLPNSGTLEALHSQCFYLLSCLIWGSVSEFVSLCRVVSFELGRSLSILWGFERSRPMPWTGLHCSERHWRCPVLLSAGQPGRPCAAKSLRQFTTVWCVDRSW